MPTPSDPCPHKNPNNLDKLKFRNIQFFVIIANQTKKKQQLENCTKPNNKIMTIVFDNNEIDK